MFMTEVWFKGLALQTAAHSYIVPESTFLQKFWAEAPRHVVLGR